MSLVTLLDGVTEKWEACTAQWNWRAGRAKPTEVNNRSEKHGKVGKKVLPGWVMKGEVQK